MNPSGWRGAPQGQGKEARRLWEAYCKKMNHCAKRYEGCTKIGYPRCTFCKEEQKRRDKRRTTAAVSSRISSRVQALRVPLFQTRTVPAREVRVRDRRIVQEVLRRANGVCECGCGVEFSYLEVHHVHQLGEGGNDSILNALALRPDCHAVADREDAFNTSLLQRLEVLNE